MYSANKPSCASLLFTELIIRAGVMEPLATPGLHIL